MNVRPGDVGDRTALVLKEIKTTKIHLGEDRGLRAIAAAWKKLLRLQKRHKCDIVPKVLAAAVLAGVSPKSVRTAITNLPKGGEPADQASFLQQNERIPCPLGEVRTYRGNGPQIGIVRQLYPCRSD